ncbi:hypothetical protein BH20ACT6_BH20ACT6_20120 [soil metagenome]
MFGPDLVLWMPWALVLSAIAAVLGVRAARRGQSISALRWAGWAFVPPALLLTGTLRLTGRIGTAVLNWSASLVFNPVMWVGIALGGIAIVLLGSAAVLRSRSGPAVDQPRRAKPLKPGKSAATRPVDDDLADIEEILRRRGIS